VSPRAKKSSRPASTPERRRNRALREVLDDLVEHVRLISRTVQTMTPEDVTYAQERLEWLADEVWRTAVEGSEPDSTDI
jgi:hypothetical protein